MGIFTDFELGQAIVVVAIIGLCIFFGGKNLLNTNSGGNSGKSNHSNNSTNNTDSNS